MFGTGQDEYSDGVPVYSLTGAAVPTWLKRVKLGGARYWVIGQSTGFLYAARVDCLREIQKRQAAEAVRGCMLHAWQHGLTLATCSTMQKAHRDSQVKRQSRRPKRGGTVFDSVTGTITQGVGLVGDTAAGVGKFMTKGITDGFQKCVHRAVFVCGVRFTSVGWAWRG